MEKNIITLKEKELQDNAGRFNLKGSGTKNDPIIIESAEIFTTAKELSIIKSHLHICIKNCNFDVLKLKKCQNLIIESSRFSHLLIYASSNLTINKTIFDNSLELYSCRDLNIENCNIKFLRLNVSYLNNFKNTSIDYLSNWASRGNVFEDIKIPETYYTELLEGDPNINFFSNYLTKLYLIVIPALFMFSLSMYFLIFFPLTERKDILLRPISEIISIVWFFGMIGFFIFSFLVLLIYGKKWANKTKKMPDNVIKKTKEKGENL